MMKNIVRFVLLGMFACFASCTEKSVREIKPLEKYDSLSISIDYPLLSNYGKLTSCVMGKEVYAVGYNHHLHSLDFINVSGGKHKVIELQREGADAVLAPQSFCVTDEHIIWNDASGIVMLTTEGKILNRLPQKELLHPEGKYFKKPQGVTNANYLNLGSDKNYAYIPLTPQKADADMRIGKKYDKQKNMVEELPLKYPDDVQKNIEWLGGMSFPNIQSYAGKVVYNFPCSSMCFVYDGEKGKTESFDMPSMAIANEVDVEQYKHLPPRQKFEMESMASRFDKIYYSKTLNKYYRIHYAQKEKLFDKSRKMYLMVYDGRSRKMAEYQLPSGLSEQYIIVDDNAYFLYAGNDDDLIRLAKVSLKDI